MYPYDPCSIIHSGQDMETTTVPFNSLLDEGVVPVNNGTSSAIRKDEILPFVTTWKDLENIILMYLLKKEMVQG